RRHCRGIEIEHLGAAITDLIKAEHLALELFPRRAHSALPPKNYTFILGYSHDAGIHPSLRLSGLKRFPCFTPGPRLASAVRKPWRRVKLKIGMQQFAESSVVTLFDRAENIEQQLAIGRGAHDLHPVLISLRLVLQPARLHHTPYAALR